MGGEGGAREVTGTSYAGPVLTAVVVVGGRPLTLVRPADPDRMLEDPGVLAWNRRDDYMPYWAYLWPGAFLLAEAVAAEPWRPGTEALEIGCGLGLAGLAGLGAGLRVTFSDYDDAPLEFVRRSAARNGFDPSTYSTRRLDWRDLPPERFPVILGADVLYEHRLVPLVAGLLDRMLAPGGLALVAGPYRVSAEGFAPAVGAMGMSCNSVAVSADGVELGPVRGTLYRVTKPGP
jgi:2-polyprenyl-3-methyl-5-hydroxy-6-metoxy-1,4-benzoquinol methylase